MATKKSKSKSEPSSIPKWGTELSPKELSKLLAKIDDKLQEEKMSKLSDTLAKALAKKKGTHHIENDGTPAKDTKKKVKTAPPTGKKPATRSAGRGR